MCVLNSCSGKYSKPEDTARSLAGMCGINASHVPIALRDHGATETIRYDPTNRAFVGFLKTRIGDTQTVRLALGDEDVVTTIRVDDFDYVCNSIVE